MSIERAVYEKNHDSHANSDRTIATVINGDIEGFASEHVRAVRFERETDAGNHWREYSELYGIIGKARFFLEDIDSKERREHTMETGDRLFVPERVALRIHAEAGTVIVTCSQKADRNSGTHAYIVK